MTINIMILVFWSIIWLILTTAMSWFWHLHTMLLYLIYFWYVWTDLLYFLLYLIILAHVSIAKTISSPLAIWLLPPLLNIQVMTMVVPFYSSQGWWDYQWDQDCLIAVFTGWNWQLMVIIKIMMTIADQILSFLPTMDLCHQICNIFIAQYLSN